jgi:hypothetical protein
MSAADTKLRQHLNFCTSKAGKLGTVIVAGPGIERCRINSGMLQIHIPVTHEGGLLAVAIRKTCMH